MNEPVAIGPIEGRCPCEEVSVRMAHADDARHASSDLSERAFCATCGSHTWMRDTDTPEADRELMPGLFDAARAWLPQSEIHSDRAFASARLAEDHRRATRAEWEAEHRSLTGDV